MTKTSVSPVAVKVATSVELKEAKEMLAFYRGRVAFLRAAVKEQRLDAKIAKSAARNAKMAEREAKAAARAQRKADRIATLEAKLSALKNPVGTKAVKANRRPSKVTVTKVA